VGGRPFTFPLCTERDIATLISVTKGGYMSKPTDLVQGTLDLLILKILALEPLHGWAIGQRLKQVSGDVLSVSDGSLYPALHKLEQEGWIKAEWKPSENNRRAKFYSLTRLGRKELEKEAANWNRLSAAISRVVKLREA
jgi:PadR family transcriptional regulator, regulatory protein PadR